jgi:hypothetical protein
VRPFDALSQLGLRLAELDFELTVPAQRELLDGPRPEVLFGDQTLFADHDLADWEPELLLDGDLLALDGVKGHG